jgi:hypothetical protein
MIDPVTLSLILKGVGKVAGNLGPSIGALLGGRAGAEAMKQDPSQIAQQYEELKKSMPQYGVGSGWNEYLAMAKQDPAADMQRQIAAEQEASAVGALKAGGAKALLGGLGASQRQAAQSRMGIEAGAQQRQQAALQQYAGQQQRVQDANTRTAQGLAESQFKAEQGAEQINKSLDAQKKAALWQLGGAALGQFGQGYFKEDGMGTLKSEIMPKTGSGASQEDILGGIKSGKIDLGNIQDIAQPEDNPDGEWNVGVGEFTPQWIQQNLLNIPGMQGSYTPAGATAGAFAKRGWSSLPYLSPMEFAKNNIEMNKSYSPPFFKDGGMITPGAFSHKKNPIHMIDENGDKVGEVTGGEVILNPEHKKKVAQQSPFFRKLLREFAMRRRND